MVRFSKLGGFTGWIATITCTSCLCANFGTPWWRSRCIRSGSSLMGARDPCRSEDRDQGSCYNWPRNRSRNGRSEGWVAAPDVCRLGIGQTDLTALLYIAALLMGPATMTSNFDLEVTADSNLTEATAEVDPALIIWSPPAPSRRVTALERSRDFRASRTRTCCRNGCIARSQNTEAICGHLRGEGDRGSGFSRITS